MLHTAPLMSAHPLPALPATAYPADLGDPPADTALADAIAVAFECSPYLRGLLRQRGAMLARIIDKGVDKWVAEHRLCCEGDRPVAQQLRLAKRDIALATALADLAGHWTLEQVTQSLSDFADMALDRALAAAIEERTPGHPVTGFVVLALGKHGSRELNYSSDLDLILLYDSSSLPRRAGEESDVAAQRIARRLVELMQARDSDGYVFRIDLRLRPSPEVTPAVLSVGAAEAYYHSEALTWERAAFIRARVVAGDRALGERFMTSIRPFIWRRAIDYTAVREIEAVSLQIRDHFEAGQQFGPGFDLKRGRGGIRECEFFAQAHQLLHGGRDASLRVPATLDALSALAAAGRIDVRDKTTLSAAYRLLRTVEHRVQMIDDAQTHALPRTAADRRTLARFCGCRDWASLAQRLERTTRAVGRIYDTLVPAQQGPARLPNEPRALAAAVKTTGIPGTQQAVRLIEGWRSASPCRALRNPAARDAFETVLPALIAAIGASGDADGALLRFDSFVRQLPAGLQFFALLQANPALIPQLARLLGLSPTLADALARTPDLFDLMLDAQAFTPRGDAAAMTAELRAVVTGAEYEDRLDRVRRWTAEQRFCIGAQIIERRIDPLSAGAAYAAVADAGLAVLAEEAEAEFARAHGVVADGRMLVLALGRYGGGLLTARSDLDLVYLFAGAHDAMSDGPKPLPATLYYNRLAQRLTAALSVPTAAGALYAVDTRLRPSGSKGLLAASIESFLRYQRDEAWPLEQMAMTRARVVHGNAEDAAAVLGGLRTLWAVPRDRESLAPALAELRRDVARAKPGQGLWDVKLSRGGLVDLEFVVHFEQLTTGVGLDPDLHVAATALADAGHIPRALVDAQRLLTRLLIVQRLVEHESDTAQAPAPVRDLLAASCGLDSFEALKSALALAKADIDAAWVARFGSQLRKEKR